jgi:hypothetical protein
MHRTDVNTKIAEKQIGEGGKSFLGFASELEIAGGHLQVILSSASQAACRGDDGATLTMIECAERYAREINAITKAMYEQSRQAKSAESIASAADSIRPKINPIPHAIAAVDVASLGMCCVEEITTFLDAIYELASADGLNDARQTKRLGSIQGIAKRAIRFAEDLHNTIDCERETLEEALEALKEASHV